MVMRRTRPFSPLWSAALALALAIALVLAIHRAAHAHAALLSSEPAAGSHLTASPDRIRLVFSEAVDPKLATLSIVGDSGKPIVLVVLGDPHDKRAIVGVPPTLAPGSYHVLWHAVSDDGHPVRGSYVFSIVGTSVGTSSAPVVVSPPPLPPVVMPPATWGPTAYGAPLIPAVLRGFGVGCAMAVAGLLFFVVWMNGGLASRPARVALAFAIAAPLLLVAHLAAWLIDASPTHTLSAAWLSTAFATKVGRTELWRTVLSFAPLCGLLLARSPALALALSVPTVVISAAAGHSAAIHPGWAIPIKALHLSAVAAWMGGLLWLAVRERDTPSRLAQEGVQVSTVALSCVVVVFLSGIAQTALLLHSIHDFNSAYGVVVLLKVAGLAVLILFGAWHRFRLLPRLNDRADHSTAGSFRGSVSREIAIFWLVILLGGFLAYLSPPTAATTQHASLTFAPHRSHV